MSSKARNAERRRENEEAYERESKAREKWEAERQEKYGDLLTKLETLGIDPYLLREYILDQERYL